MGNVLVIAGGFTALIVSFATVAGLITKHVNKSMDIYFRRYKDEFDKSFRTLDGKLDEVAKTVRFHERSRLANEIMKFASRLRRGEEPSLVEFKQIYSNFSRYFELGGNSYAQQEKALVDKCYREYHVPIKPD